MSLSLFDQLEDIPSWMEPLIEVITYGELKTKEELKVFVNGHVSTQFGSLVFLNNRICFLKELRDRGLLKI